MRRLLLVLGAGLLWVAPVALAQDGQRSAPAQGGKRAASPSAPKNAWVKLCETPKAPAKDILGRPQAVGVESCLTVAERVNAGTGTRLIGVGVRQSGKRRTLTVMVPAGVDRRGMLVVIYPRSQWKLGAKGVLPEKHKWDQLTSLKLDYTSCDAEECMAETDATPELIKDLRTKAGLVVSTIRDKRIVLLPISLGGFRAAYDGPGIDSARFRKARDELMRELRERSKKRPRQPAKRPGEQEI
jgi:invasion protein IalB